MKIKLLSYIVSVLSLLSLSGCASAPNSESTPAEATAETAADTTPVIDENAPQLTFIGHSSMKIKTTEGTVIYIDPAYDKNKDLYSEPADIILVTHAHGDHNNVRLVTKGEDCQTITQKEALVEKGDYQSFEIDGVKIEAVPAENSNHSIKNCVGYVLTFDDITLYHAGDTSTLASLTDMLSTRELDYACFPIDGNYNMDAAEATAFADSIGAKHNIPMHIVEVTEEYDEAKAKTFTPSGATYVKYGEIINLVG